MNDREILSELAGGESNLGVLQDLVSGAFRNGEAAESHKVGDGPMTRRAQRAKALLAGVHRGWRALDGLAERIKAEVRGLPRKALETLLSVELETPAAYERIYKRNERLIEKIKKERHDTAGESGSTPSAAKTAATSEGLRSDSANESSETTCRQYARLFKDLARIQVAGIAGLDVGAIRRLHQQALRHMDAIGSAWQELTGFLPKLDPDSIRDVDIGELRRLAEDGLGLIDVARPKFQKVVALLSGLDSGASSAILGAGERPA